MSASLHRSNFTAELPIEKPRTRGFLRIVRFSPAAHTLTVATYSPYVDQSLTDDANQFTLPLD